jgi:hypothetical protein
MPHNLRYGQRGVKIPQRIRITKQQTTWRLCALSDNPSSGQCPYFTWQMSPYFTWQISFVTFRRCFTRVSAVVEVSYVFRRVRKIAKETISFVVSVFLSVRPSVCPSDRMEQLDCHWADFYEICYLSIVRKSVKKNQVSLQSDKKRWWPLHSS